jgi:hypothetical protein
MLNTQTSLFDMLTLEPQKLTSETPGQPNAYFARIAAKNARVEKRAAAIKATLPQPLEVSVPFTLADLEADIPLETATRAHSGTSWDPDKRGAQERAGYSQHLMAVHAELAKRATTPEQQAALPGIFEEYRNGYKRRTLDLLGSRQGLVSAYIAGPSNFPTRRMEKKNNAVDKRMREVAEYPKWAMKRAEKALQAALTPEDSKAQASSATHSKLMKEAAYNLGIVRKIDAGEIHFTRSAFTNSLKGYLERAAKNGEHDAVQEVLAFIKAEQVTLKRPFFAPNNAVWKLELACRITTH